jgi:putative flippase GtrA
MKAELLRFAKFVLVGGLNTTLTFGIYEILLLYLTYLPAYTLAFASGIAISYLLSGSLVFRSELSVRRGVVYALFYLGVYLLNAVLIAFCVRSLGIAPAWAPLLVLVITVPVNFIGARRIHRSLHIPCKTEGLHRP